MPRSPSRPLLIAETAAFTSLITLGAWVSIPFLPVPITLQTLFVILAGAVMGRYGIYPSSLYVLMGALNIPVFHNGTAGIPSCMVWFMVVQRGQGQTSILRA